MIITGDKEAIKSEIYANGPVQSSILAKRDLLNYKKGIYQNVDPAHWGGTGIEILGWGKDETSGLEFWIAKFSFGEKWGENGYARIKMGESDIASWVYACIPDVVADEGGMQSEDL